MAHIKLQARQIGVVLGVEASVGMAKNVLNPAAAKARIVADFTPTALPVGWAYMGLPLPK